MANSILLTNELVTAQIEPIEKLVERDERGEGAAQLLVDPARELPSFYRAISASIEDLVELYKATMRQGMQGRKLADSLRDSVTAINRVQRSMAKLRLMLERKGAPEGVVKSAIELSAKVKGAGDELETIRNWLEASQPPASLKSFVPNKSGVQPSDYQNIDEVVP